jgi:hypothetical protein
MQASDFTVLTLSNLSLNSLPGYSKPQLVQNNRFLVQNQED